MRGKRAKQYRKLMQQYGMSFGFREPYQVLLDAEMLHAAAGFKMDLVAGLERTLQGQVKPMISQCSMRHLYTANPPVPRLIDQAKTFERRRCNHHTLDEPLSTLECISDVVDIKHSGTNKHRYVVASQSPEVRASMRNIPGVPLVYLRRSVMIMEPMGSATERKRESGEREKFEAGLKGKRAAGSTLKRKRDGSPAEGGDVVDGAPGEESSEAIKKRKKKAKGPNPLSVKRTKKTMTKSTKPTDATVRATSPTLEILHRGGAESDAGQSESATKKKRRRKHKSSTLPEQPDTTHQEEVTTVVS
ncbi:MAG: hypothetical protein M4579_002807 [Chaenotheca gracillima]|nr:MAG: hypothetical protein M4579_002807 [Chaenotheca gracillima]